MKKFAAAIALVAAMLASGFAAAPTGSVQASVYSPCAGCWK